jgi:tetratricopeptide (TPR) repeat protein
MDSVFQTLWSLLEQTWAGVTSFLNLETLQTASAAALNGLSDDLVRESIAVGVAVFFAVMLIGRLLGRSRRAEADLLRERLRELELKLEAARDEIAAAKRLQNDLQKGDPLVFASALATAIAEDGPKARDLDPETWLAPLRPALADAHLKLARGILGKSKGEEDLARARSMAIVAATAEPERKECAELLARIEEAERRGLFSELSEADALAWRIARREAEALDHKEGESRGLVTRSSGQIGHAILLSGWETEDLHAAALAELADHGLGAAFETGEARESAESEMTGRAKTGRRGRKAGRAASGADAMIDGARVVSLLSGVSARDGGAIEEAEEAEPVRAIGAGSTSRGSTVLMMPHGRGTGRDAVDRVAGTASSGRGGRDDGNAQPLDASEREAEHRRLWERRRRPDMLGETHPRTLGARANMAYEIGRQGRHAEAEAIFREVIEAMGSAEAPGDHQTEALSVRHNLAMELLRQGKLDEAEAELEEILGELGSPTGRKSSAPVALAAAHGLGEVWSARGDHGEAEKAFNAVWQSRSADEAFGPDHPHTLWSRVRMLREAAASESASAG